jgi:hypothetical protein
MSWRRPRCLLSQPTMAHKRQSAQRPDPTVKRAARNPNMWGTRPGLPGTPGLVLSGLNAQLVDGNLRSSIGVPPLSAVVLIYFFVIRDLNEIPRRIVRFFMASGDRRVILATSSNGFEARASFINRRSSLNDQRRMRTIIKPSVSDEAAKRSMFVA